ncbi:TldD/PmbA family protein [Clostridium felsineum]|uniref:TldD/PmbA family protein n=1 Tax=Clostridium felsineum TaxID=36839 RepID=UPI00098C6ACE|nr:TldD/PmbA family protein [Clostridium felsineum]URZ00688.1 Metalloprotease TldD [Clostridium felsineum]
MINKTLIQDVLEASLKTGADFAEIFVEDTISNDLFMSSLKLKKSTTSREFGIGIRIIKGLRSVYAYTNSKDKETLLKTAKEASLALGDLSLNKSIVLKERLNSNIHPVLYVPSSVGISDKKAIIERASLSAKNYDKSIVQVETTYKDSDQKIIIANSFGLYTTDRRIHSRMTIKSVASDGIENQTGYIAPGRSMGIEMFDVISPEKCGVDASEMAITMLKARPCPSGKMTVAIENGFGGVIFHEACGHALEASSISKNLSVFSNKLGEKIASSKVTAVDDGTIKNAYGSINIDDEGNPSEKKILIENGILKSYMVDYLSGKRMGVKANGSSRRESYKFAPTSRMTNTYIKEGEDDSSDIIASIDNGLYAKRMGGGSVNPITGEFNFSVLEGYLVKNGKIKEPVRGASLIGKSTEILNNIDMVGKNLALGSGTCGAASGNIPTNVGQPLIRVSEITVGGR